MIRKDQPVIITTTSSDNDWVGLYVGDDLALENHTLNVYEVLYLIESLARPIKYEQIVISEQYLDLVGTLPSTLAELQGNEWKP